MNTRTRKNFDGPISQSRYMSSPEFRDLRGVSAIAVSAKASIQHSQAKRNLLWFIQGMSLQDGGLRRMAHEIIDANPDRLKGVYSGDEPRTLAVHGKIMDSHFYERRFLSVEQFLVDLCINPRGLIRLPGESEASENVESEKVREEYPELDNYEIQNAGLPYFKDIIGAICSYKKQHEESARQSFYLTAIGRKVWQVLDRALAAKRMVLLDGLEGRGKTEAVRTWCQLHLGQARYVSLNGITNKTTAFRSIAKALGVASTYTRTAPEMQARIEDVLQRSKLLLVIDEAHFAFNQSRRMYSRPEIIDWIDTALCNHGVPVALITTPQFVERITQAVQQVDWNFKQFRRRVSKWEVLPKKNTDEDVRGVIQHVFPNASARVVEEVAAYVTISERDLSAIGDVVDELRAAGADDLGKVSGAQMRSAIDQLLIGDVNFKRGMDSAKRSTKTRLAQPMPDFSTSVRSDGKDAHCNQKTETLTEREMPVRIRQRSSISDFDVLTPT